MLRGIELTPSDHAEADDSLHFLVEGQLVEVRTSRDEVHDRPELRVGSPLDIAERCWDAGGTVQVDGSGADTTLHVSDPLGRTIALLPRAGWGF